jgi:seryl-tRNA synthetase
MLDIKRIVENKEAVKQALSFRKEDFDIDKAAELDKKRRDIIVEVESLKATRNSVSDKISAYKREKKDASEMIAQMKALGENIKELDIQLKQVERELENVMLYIPNIPHQSVPGGESAEQNVVVRQWGEIKEKDLTFKPHWDIGEQLGILDFSAAAKISGARFTVYRDKGAALERAVVNFMLDTHTHNGYTEIFAPYLVNRETMTGTGQLPKFEEDMFAVKGTDYFLIPTAEVTLTNLFRNEIIQLDRLPVSYCAYSACFRAEAGSAGRDTRGLIRQHQFNKVELVKFCNPEDSYQQLEKLTSDAESILRLLNIPYRVVLLCAGDMGFSSAKTYDLEVWMPGCGRYVEISSCSNFESFQARRANIKYRDINGKPQFVHTLNGSGLAAGRTVAAILENYQNADGSVTVPDCLVKYLGCDVIK